LIEIHGRINRPAESGVIGSCAYVADTDRHVVGKLALDIDRILLDPRRRSILVDITDRRAYTAERASAVAGRLHDAAREWVIERDGWNWRGLRTYGVLSVTDLPVVIGGGARNRVIVRRPKHPITTADNSLRGEGISRTKPWRPVHRRRVALIVPVSADTCIHQATGYLPRGCARHGIRRNRHAVDATGCFGIETDAEVIVAFPQAILMLRTQT